MGELRQKLLHISSVMFHVILVLNWQIMNKMITFLGQLQNILGIPLQFFNIFPNYIALVYNYNSMHRLSESYNKLNSFHKQFIQYFLIIQTKYTRTSSLVTFLFTTEPVVINK